MNVIALLEDYDARWGIPRPADAEHLPAFQAALFFFGAVVEGCVLLCCGGLSAYLLWKASGFVGARAEVELIFVAGMLLVVVISLLECVGLATPYYRFHQRLAHGSSRWADPAYLTQLGLAKLEHEALAPGTVRIGRLRRGHDLILPVAEWLRHVCLFGPPGAGKSRTFLMNMLRDVAAGGSAVVLDPKGELYEQTARYFRRVYRLDLVNPRRSDRWNFVPRCREDPEFAHQMAATMIGIEATRHTVTDPFWGEAELVALCAILLQLPLVVDHPTPPMVYEYAALRDDESFAADMMNSPSLNVRLAWGAFTKAPPQTRGSVMTGLANKLHPFLVRHAQEVTAPISAEEAAAGVQQINFTELRVPGTAVYIVIQEGDASRYKTFLSTFIGQAVIELRTGQEEGGESETTPTMFVLDEAGSVPVRELKELVGVGRGRRVGLVLGYQNLPQVQDQYGHDGANSILGSIGTMIFLPGLDDSTSQYASRRIGQTTVWSHTTVDDHGAQKLSNERYAETGRALMDPSELRRMRKHRQALVIIDTAPPIKASYPPYAMERTRAVRGDLGTPRPVSLIEAEAAFQARQAGEVFAGDGRGADAGVGVGGQDEFDWSLGVDEPASGTVGDLEHDRITVEAHGAEEAKETVASGNGDGDLEAAAAARNWERMCEQPGFPGWLNNYAQGLADEHVRAAAAAGRHVLPTAELDALMAEGPGFDEDEDAAGGYREEEAEQQRLPL